MCEPGTPFPVNISANFGLPSVEQPVMTKDEITRPEPGTLPARISFVEQNDGSAGYYVRFKDVPENSPSGGEPERKYVPILQYESQDEALQAAIEHRNRRAEKLGLPIEATQGPHTEEAREQMSSYHNRLGLRGLGLSLDNSAGTIYPQLVAMWTDKDGQEKVRRGMASRGIWATVELLVPYLQEHIHTEKTEEELARRGSEGTARRLAAIAVDSSKKAQVRRRIEVLFERWSKGSDRDRELIEQVR